MNHNIHEIIECCSDAVIRAYLLLLLRYAHERFAPIPSNAESDGGTQCSNREKKIIVAVRFN